MEDKLISKTIVIYDEKWGVHSKDWETSIFLKTTEQTKRGVAHENDVNDEFKLIRIKL